LTRAALALVLLAACGPARPSSEPAPAPIASESSAPVASVAPVEPAPKVHAVAGAFHVVREGIHPREKANPFIARLGNRDTGRVKLAPIDPKIGPLADAAADAACYVASGRSTDTDASCAAKIDSVTGATLAVTVDVGFEDDSMQSRAKTHATLTGTITIDASTHEVVRASFRGRETFEERSPCEKNEGCDACDPLVRKAGCAAKCYCPFRAAGTADVETTYAR
jgi:hypothetical protein